MQKAAKLANEYDMLPSGGLVLCAVSGGADSVCLLHLLRALSGRMGFRLAAAHFNHLLRGEASDGDEAFVRSLCETWGIPLYTGRGDTAGAAKQAGRGLEETARELRYAFLRRTAEAIGANRIATAHTADDNLETILMRFVRGSGLRGLRGIPPRRGEIVRPLLNIERREVLSYLKAHGLSHREDESNGDRTYTRNRLRMDVIPLLRKENPRLGATAAETAAALRRDDAFLEAAALRASDSLRTQGEDRVIAAKALALAPDAVAARLAGLILNQIGAGRDVTAAHIAGVLALARGDDPSARLTLRGGVQVRRVYEDLIFSWETPAPRTFAPTPLNLEGETIVPGAGVRIVSSVGKMQEGNFQSDNTFWLNYDIIGGPLVVRPRAAGDRIALPRRGGSKTLKKLFIEERVPRHLRETIPVLADGRGVAAVAGFGPDKARAAAPGDLAIKIVIEGNEHAYASQ